MSAPTLRVPFAILFALMLGAAFLSTGGAEVNAVSKITEGVWFREGDLKNLGHCNNTIIEMKDYLIVVDANFPSGARLTMDAARKVSPKPVKYVFITHHHGDHDYGAAVWSAAGATTLAYKVVAEEIQRYEPYRWKNTAKSRRDVAELKMDAPELPRQTFDKSPFMLKDSTREVQFHFFGWAHTRGDGFAWLPKERVLVTGDAVTNGPHNNTADASLGNWPVVMDAAARLMPLHVLPGHGPAGGPELLTGQAAFMRELMGAVREAVGEGKLLSDIVTMKEDKAIATSLKLPDSVSNWTGHSLPEQVVNAYNETVQKRPAGELPHN